MKHSLFVPATLAIIAAVGLALAVVNRPSYPGLAVPASVASSLRGGNCPSVAALTCQGSGIHGNGTTCPVGSIVVAGNQWSCNPTGNGYCCGISSCWMCYTGWLTCIN